MSVIAQIRKNAQSVIDDFGPESGVSEFGYNVASIAYLDGFIERQWNNLRTDEQTRLRFVSLVGSFLGEAIINTYGGRWIEDLEDSGLPEGMADIIRQQHGEGTPVLVIDEGDDVHCLNPLAKVEKRIVHGREDDLEFYFAEFIPPLLRGESPPTLPQAATKPWWRFW